MFRQKRKFCSLLVLIFLSFSFSAMANKDYLVPQVTAVSKMAKADKAAVKLGKMLFFDPRLSGSNWISCATCHNPARGWSDGLPTAIGHGMTKLGRATPTILNTTFNPVQFWDGRATTLEEQALGPIQAAGEMNQNLDELVRELNEIKGYRKAFKKVYGDEGITKANIGKAIAAYERTITSTDSKFDRWISGKEKSLSKAASRGFKLFEGKAACVSCHSGFNFTDNRFHNLGLKGTEDLGRMAVSQNEKDKGAFKTPTLRDVELTAPYMHNGMYATLEDVVEHYDRGGDAKENLSPLMQPLNLTKREKADLVAFMKSLTGKAQKVSLPQLPN
ncbi:MAG: c-type cytochrome [Gammaproteobacteria bacterium]|nr:c-type cytochrome [Gammaproteobacteria bacterium]